MKRLRILKIKDFDVYYDQVIQGPNRAEEMQHLLNAITTNKTDFFRESKQWEFLQNQLWPEIQREKKARKENSIRIWSSACSSGEEPYTIAIHTLEHLKPSSSWKIQILASDISEKVLAIAREGFYDHSRAVQIPPLYLNKYFEKKSRRVSSQTRSPETDHLSKCQSESGYAKILTTLGYHLLS